MNPSNDAKYLIDQILEVRHERLEALRTSAPDIEHIERLEYRCVELSDTLSSVVDAAGATGWGIGDDVAEAMVRLEAALGQLATEEQRAAGWKAWENYRQAAVAGGLDSMVMLKTINQRDGLAIVTGGAAVDQGGDAPQREQAQGTDRRTIAQQIGAECWRDITMKLIMDPLVEAESKENPCGVVKIRLRARKQWHDFSPQELMRVKKHSPALWRWLSRLAVHKGSVAHNRDRQAPGRLAKALADGIGLPSGKCIWCEGGYVKCGFTITHQMQDMRVESHIPIDEDQDYDCEEIEGVYG